MSRNLWRRTAARLAPLPMALGAILAATGTPASAFQGPVTPRPLPPGAIESSPAPAAAPVVDAPGVAVVGPQALPPEIQVVRFSAPEGTTIEVLGPMPEPVPTPAAADPNIHGLKVGVGYRLKLSNLPNRQGAELYPVVEVVGHLHRPAEVDPARFPIRVNFGMDDVEDAVDRGKMVTEVVYLEDPEQALPVDLPKDQIPIVTITPSEEPLRVAAALGRVTAIVRIGGRRPGVEELAFAEASLGFGIPAGAPCPFAGPGGTACALPCGPARGTPPPPGRRWLPGDEYLCDGGDGNRPIQFGGDGGLRGIDPRDAAIGFRALMPANLPPDRPRVLPTNRVCIYAPRFAAVRALSGADASHSVVTVRGANIVQGGEVASIKEGPVRLAQAQAAELNRHRARVSGFAGRVGPAAHQELRVLAGVDVSTHIAGNVKVERVEGRSTLAKAMLNTGAIKSLDFNRPESAAATGIIQGPNQSVGRWPASEMVGVEVPPSKPGLVVLKTVGDAVAEPGDAVTFTIRFRNMGNVPIGSVSIVDSLLPRLKYVVGSAQGPRGAVFTAEENRVGSSDLRWDVPGVVEPGVEGSVTFQAIVR